MAAPVRRQANPRRRCRPACGRRRPRDSAVGLPLRVSGRSPPACPQPTPQGPPDGPRRPATPRVGSTLCEPPASPAVLASGVKTHASVSGIPRRVPARRLKHKRKWKPVSSWPHADTAGLPRISYKVYRRGPHSISRLLGEAASLRMVTGTCYSQPSSDQRNSFNFKKITSWVPAAPGGGAGGREGPGPPDLCPDTALPSHSCGRSDHPQPGSWLG